MDKPICIEVGLGVGVNDLKTKNVYWKDNFTTNKNYIGHTDEDVPVYYNKFLNEKEIKYIMNKEFKKLNDGKYDARIEQVIYKHGKDAEGKEDTTKNIISLELNVRGQQQFYYLTYCVEGYSEEQCKMSKENLDKIMGEFKVSKVDELVMKVGKLIVKTKDNGKQSMYFVNPEAKEFFDWTKQLTIDCDAKFECEVLKLYNNGNKNIFIVKANVNGQEIEEFIPYNMTNQIAAQSFDWVLKKLGITFDGKTPVNDINKKALLRVKRTSDFNKIYINKSITFPKQAKRKPQAW